MCDWKFHTEQQAAAFPVSRRHLTADSFHVPAHDPEADAEVERIAGSGWLDRLVKRNDRPGRAIGSSGVERPVIRRLGGVALGEVALEDAVDIGWIDAGSVILDGEDGHVAGAGKTDLYARV